MLKIFIYFLIVFSSSLLLADTQQCLQARPEKYAQDLKQDIQDREILFNMSCKPLHLDQCIPLDKEDYFTFSLFALRGQLVCCSNEHPNQGTLFDVDVYFRNHIYTGRQFRLNFTAEGEALVQSQCLPKSK